ncbi:MAG: DUF421 domain-containing protein [Bacillota bacterium]|jgi:uncharacterized membrane protein YcaP (DUF421 family)
MAVIMQVIWRSVISFFVLLLFVRLIGKQQVSELTNFDYIVGITIGSIASFASVEIKENFPAALVGIIVWALLAILLSYAGLHSVWIRKIVDGEAVVVIEDGCIKEDSLRRIRVSLDELLSQLRTLQIFDISEVEFAMFEPTGKLSVRKKSQLRTITPADLQLSTRYEGMPTNLIDDGTILVDALKSLGLSKAWLMHQLEKKAITDPRSVTLAQLDTKGQLYVDLKGDQKYHIIQTDS